MGSNPTPRIRDKPYTLDKVSEVLWQMKKDGYSENTLETFGRRLRYLAKHIDLHNPDEVKTFIAKANWSSGYKRNVVTAYNHYTVFHKISWRKPKYQRAFSIKKLPLESDIDLIISYTRTRNRVAFTLVKECGLRPIEVSNLTLKQIDLHKGRLYPESEPNQPYHVQVNLTVPCPSEPNRSCPSTLADFFIRSKILSQS